MRMTRTADGHRNARRPVMLQNFTARANSAETAVLNCEFPRQHAETTTQEKKEGEEEGEKPTCQ